MSTASAAQTPRTPQSARDGDGEHARTRDERRRHRQRQVAAVARPDQDPVEREHRSVERLHQREDRPQQRALRRAPRRPT